MFKRILAITTSAVTMLALTMAPACVFAASGNIEKDETVYVITDSTGSQNEVIVSDHLKNTDKVDQIEDKTNLSDIENVKGDEEFDKGDNSFITWNAKGKDIYYQGKTNKEVPVTMDVTYTLDGKEVSGKELDGASGKVTIRINYTNHTSYNGSKVPFIVMSGFIVQDNCFRDITIDHGKVIDDGDKKMVVGIAAPGVAEMLGVSGEEIGISDSVYIKGKAKDFAVDDIMTVATSDVFNELDTGEIGDLDFDDEINALNKGSKKLVEGSKALYEGLHEADDNMPALMKGARKLDKGAKKLGSSLMDQMDDMVDGLTQLETGASSVLSGLQYAKSNLDSKAIPALETISGSLDAAASGLEDNHIPQHAASVAQYMATFKKAEGIISAHHDAIKAALVAGGLSAADAETLLNTQKIEGVVAESNAVSLALNGDGSNTLPKQLKTASGGISQVVGHPTEGENASTGLYQLSESLGSTNNPKTLVGGTAAIYGGLDKIKNKISETTAPDGSLTTGMKELTNGTGKLRKGTRKLGNGISQLDKGSLQLSQGMSKLYNEGIKKIVDLYNDDLKGLTSGLSGMMNAAEDYKSFTLLPPDMSGATKFIYKTPITE